MDQDYYEYMDQDYYSGRPASKPVEPYTSVVEDFYDCETVSVSTQKLGLSQSGNYENIVIEAFVTEKGTGESCSAN